LLHKSNRAGVAFRGAARDEMAPGAGMPDLLNRRPLDREPSLEGSGFDILKTARAGFAFGVVGVQWAASRFGCRSDALIVAHRAQAPRDFVS